jgi:hypothetical protein
MGGAGEPGQTAGAAGWVGWRSSLATVVRHARQSYAARIRHRSDRRLDGWAPIRGRWGGCDATERKAGVFETADIREWRGHEVVDSEGHKIGELEAVYVDTSTDLPAFGTVKVGLPTRHRLVFVPLAGATVGPGYLKVAYDRKQVKDSPSISTEGELPAADEEAIFRHYGLTYQPGTSGERQLARR